MIIDKREKQVGRSGVQSPLAAGFSSPGGSGTPFGGKYSDAGKDL